MTAGAHDSLPSLLANIRTLVDQRLSGAKAAEANQFIERYFAQIDLDDLASRTAEDLYGAAMAHMAFAREFAGGAPKLRVYNPRVQEHGWASGNTVIEIVNDDMPFLVDSVTMEVNRQGYTLQLFVHPIFKVKRDREHHWQGLDGDAAESFIHVEVERETDPARLKALGAGLAAVLADVRAAVNDWPRMREQVQAAQAGLTAAPVSSAEQREISDFLAWVYDNHFTLLGFRDYDLTGEGSDVMLNIVPNSGLGILREPRSGVSASFKELPAEIRKLALAPTPLVLTKANTRSTIHRPGYLDYIGIKRFNGAGKVVGERRFIGLYTSSAYNARPDEVPLLRQKVAAVVEKAGLGTSSHLGKNLLTVLETYPRDELLQIDATALFDTAMGILRLGDRRKIRVFMRRDAYGRYFSALVYLPRESFNTENRVKVQKILMESLAGTSSEFTVLLSDVVLARIHLIIRGTPVDAPQPDVRAIEAKIVTALRRWEDDLAVALTQEAGEAGAAETLRDYRHAFPVTYRESVSPRAAMRDIAEMQALSDDKPMALSLYRPVEADEKTLRLRVYKLGDSMKLSGSLPMLENMGVTVQDEHSYTVTPTDGSPVQIHDFGLSAQRPVADVSAIKPNFEEVFQRVWNRTLESDGFNRLALLAGLSAANVVLIRAYAKYLKQAGLTFSQTYVEHTLAVHPDVSAMLAQLFDIRFNPALTGDRAAQQGALMVKIESALNAVTNLDEDRILRRFLAAILATLRTNDYQRAADGSRKNYLSFKLESAKVPDLPEPKPLYEIFVYSPRVEAIHLRGGKVARGGLRWSDRMEDFRTEVLGLVKAQMVKNAVIVPVGSKGGFVVKNPPPAGDREAYLKEGVACYQTFLRGLLDITDNRVGGKIKPPLDVVRHDGDDPYLVVAADKGTATFSDIANGISAEYGHWLGDAFASGGSAGYDHKKMGITAKGAWESVKRQFRGMGHNTQTTDFTVVGVGDMSGDVFGNGMLLSKHIRLLAAFDHRHIFLDPNPDSAVSFKERERMFALPRSSWEDYDKSLISKGGGIFARSAKSIPLSPEVKAALDVTADAMTPVELMSAILKAPVDLLYNGGIGTYVKAASQSHGDVGDRANDALRVNGCDLRCKVVAEGGNLGFTQLGRVEYERVGGPERDGVRKGGLVFTDAIDNSAGVDCSDHEVNIKILLAAILEQGELTEKQRNKLLADMTDEVGALVLADNYYQTQSLTVSGVRGEKLLDAQQALMRAMEKAGRLSRRVEYLPSDDVIAERRAKKQGLTAPERAVLLAYSKMALFDQLIESDLIDDDYLQHALIDYFPKPLTEKYLPQVKTHPLKREIIATVVVNTMINRTGSVFVHRMQEETGATPDEVVRAYTFVRDIFELNPLWQAIDALDYQVSAAVQSQMLIDVGRVLLRATLWFLRRRREKLPMGNVIDLFRPVVQNLAALLPQLLTSDDASAMATYHAELTKVGVPDAVATRVAALDALYGTLDIAEVAGEYKQAPEAVAKLYFELAGQLDMRWLSAQIAKLPTDTTWQGLARNALRDDLSSQQRAVTTAVVKLAADAGGTEAALKVWNARYAQPTARLKQMVNDFKAGPQPDLAMLSVLLRELRALG